MRPREEKGAFGTLLKFLIKAISSFSFHLKCLLGSREMAQQVETLAKQAWCPESDPQNPHKGR